MTKPIAFAETVKVNTYIHKGVPLFLTVRTTKLAQTYTNVEPSYKMACVLLTDFSAALLLFKVWKAQLSRTRHAIGGKSKTKAITQFFMVIKL